MRAENFAVRFADDQFDKTIGLANCARFAARAKLKIFRCWISNGLLSQRAPISRPLATCG